VKHVPTAELVSMQLYIKGGARFRTKDNAGVEALALRTAVTGGTTTDSILATRTGASKVTNVPGS